MQAKLLKTLNLRYNTDATLSKTITAQKLKLFTTYLLVNVTKSSVTCGFAHIYWRATMWKTLLFVQCIQHYIYTTLHILFYTKSKYIYIYIYIYIHRHVFRTAQGSSVWTGLTGRKHLMSPECSKHQLQSLAKYIYIYIYSAQSWGRNF